MSDIDLVEESHVNDVVLPDCTLNTLLQCENVMVEASKSVYLRQSLIQQVKETALIEKCCGLLHQGKEADFFHLGAIMKQIVFLNDVALFEQILQETLFASVVQCLECTAFFVSFP